MQKVVALVKTGSVVAVAAAAAVIVVVAVVLVVVASAAAVVGVAILPAVPVAPDVGLAAVGGGTPVVDADTQPTTWVRITKEG